jgi:hypothetical protein
MWEEEDDFKETAMIVSRAEVVQVEEPCDPDEEEAPEFRPRVRSGLNKCMSARSDAPSNWMFNAQIECVGHPMRNDQGKLLGYEECHCKDCVLKDHVHLAVGEPVQPQYSIRTAERLKAEGYVGIYEPLPPAMFTCVVCSKVIPLVDVLDDEHEEVVHFGCLSEEEQSEWARKGFRSPYIIRRKDDANRVMDGKERNNECPVEGSPEEGGMPLQSESGEGSPMAGWSVGGGSDK